MKITQRQLRRLIKEELRASLLSEKTTGGVKTTGAETGGGVVMGELEGNALAHIRKAINRVVPGFSGTVSFQFRGPPRAAINPSTVTIQGEEDNGAARGAVSSAVMEIHRGEITDAQLDLKGQDMASFEFTV